MTGLVDLTLAPLPARGQAVESVVDETRLIRCPPACGRGLLTTIGRVAFALARCLGKIGRSLRTATVLVGIALSGTGRDLRIVTGLGGNVRDPPRRSIDRSRSRAWSPLSSGHSRSEDRGRRARREQREGVETVAVSQAPVVSEASATVAPPVAGGAVTALLSAVQDLARFFLSLAGSSSLGAVGSVAGAAVPASGVGAQLCPSAPGGGAVASCAATAVPAVAVEPSSASAAVPGSSGRSVRKRSPTPAGVDVARPAVGPAVRVRDVLGIAPLPLVALLDAGRSPIGLLLLKMTESSLLLPLLDVRLELLLASLALLRRATARLVLALRGGGRGLPP